MSRYFWFSLTLLVCLLATAACGLSSNPLASTSVVTPVAEANLPNSAVVVDGTLALREGVTAVDEDFVTIAGEITNQTGEWVQYIRIEMELLDASGQPLVTEWVYAKPELVPPGATAVFSFIRSLSEINGTYASYRITDISAIPSADNGQRAIVENPSQSELDIYVTLTGELKSVGRVPCLNPHVIAASYNAEGKLDNVTSHYLLSAVGFQDELAVGQSEEFEFVATKHDAAPAGAVKVWGGCEE
ncbi:MAG: FxLYD domain-containing protein [Chloroflexi bacterium]|nr:FxLYD domain-containing protein [Chloroflexota bacterium]